MVPPAVQHIQTDMNPCDTLLGLRLPASMARVVGEHRFLPNQGCRLAAD